MLVHSPSVCHCVPPRRPCPMFGPHCRTWQTGEREDVQGVECLPGQEATDTSFAQPLEQGRLRRQLDGVFSLFKGRDEKTGVVKEIPAECKKKKLLFRVIKHWNSLWEVLEPSSLETSGTSLCEDLSSLLISHLQCQRLDLCVCCFFSKKPSVLQHCKKSYWHVLSHKN